MDDVEIVAFVHDPSSAARWRQILRDGERLERDGRSYHIIQVLELERPLGAPSGGRVWIVKGRRDSTPLEVIDSYTAPGVKQA